jgi:serine protease AprX
MRNYIGIWLVLTGMGIAQAQSLSQHWVYFTDKGDGIEQFGNPFTLFSPRAVERKARLNILIDFHDIPVSPLYTKELSEHGHRIVMISKWLNAALVETNDPEAILYFPFVDKVKKRGVYKAEFTQIPEEDDMDFAYGVSGLQIEMLRGDYLHDRGFSGSGVLIAVFDGGFHNTQNIPAFDHMRNEGNLKGTYSFVLQDSNIYTRGSHGTHVLSVMAAFDEGTYVGSAPDAEYWLFMTEDQLVEVNAEEYNWLAAAEVSDSLGVDIINSSLGYSTFDPGENDYAPSDLDGQTGVVTQAALFAARKGILVVNSAGNAGADPTWWCCSSTIPTSCPRWWPGTARWCSTRKVCFAATPSKARPSDRTEAARFRGRWSPRRGARRREPPTSGRRPDRCRRYGK